MGWTSLNIQVSILISHTSVAPFIQEAALALHEAKWLDRFITTVRYAPDSRWQKLAFKGSKTIGFDLERQVKRRAVIGLPLAKVESHPIRELVRLLISKIDRSQKLTDLIWELSEPAFDRLVAKKITSKHTAVYGYEFSSLASFTRARELGVTTIYDVPAPETNFVQRMLEDETVKNPILQTPYYHHTKAREDRRTIRRNAEWQAADIVIAASSFTKTSFATAGRDVSKVRIVPYGSPPPITPQEAMKGGSTNGKLKLLWAGTFNSRKGAHYLVEAWRRHNLGRIAQLKVFGAQVLPPELLQPIPEGFEFMGSVPREELMSFYQSSDALVFPTLCDGFGMVVTEAWSRGLPVITTKRAGASDLLRPNENGLLCEPGDSKDLAETIQWCCDHRSELRAMRPAARDTAAKWQWSDYRAGIQSVLRPTMEQI